MTPFPAAKPSAFKTYGDFIVSKNLNASSIVSLLKVFDLPQGMLFLNIKSLEKSLLPSN